MNRLYLLITILFSAGSFADYLNHPEIENLIEELVNTHNFDEKTFVNKIMFKNFINNFFISYSG